MDIIELLASDNFIMYNKHIAKMCGIEEAILLGALCSYQKGFKNKEFYREQEKILDDTALTLYSLRKAMKTLQSLGILLITKKGLPAKHYYKINTDALAKFLSSRPIENDSTSAFEINSTNNNYNKNNYNIEKALKGNSNIQESNTITTQSLTSSTTLGLENESSSSKNTALTAEKSLIINQADTNETKPSHTNRLSLDSGKIKEIIDYLNNKLKTRYSVYSKKSNTHIRARLNEGYSVEDFKLVIDQKYKDWYNTEYAEYLRPETLFGTKFEGYLNKALMNKPKTKIETKKIEKGVFKI